MNLWMRLKKKIIIDRNLLSRPEIEIDNSLLPVIKKYSFLPNTMALHK